MNPAFGYYGGKTRMAPEIVAILPAHRVYIEPFAGSLAVLFGKPPSTFEVVNDLDAAITTFYRVLRDQPDELARVCRLTPHARSEYDRADPDEPGIADLEVARRWFCRVTQSFNKSGCHTTGWSVTTSRSQPVVDTIRNRIERFAALAERLARVSIECCDAAGLVQRLAGPDAVVYVDPPYVRDSRSSSAKRKGDYRCEMDDDGHRRLAAALRATPARVVLSGYPSDLYGQLYGDWCRTEFSVGVSSANLSRVKSARRTEVLWTNFDARAGQGRLAFGASR